MKVAISKLLSQGTFLAESPAHFVRGVETSRNILEAKLDFTDQPSVDTYVVARGGAAGDYVILDLGAAGVR
jgi:hypothetical protein